MRYRVHSLIEVDAIDADAARRQAANRLAQALVGRRERPGTLELTASQMQVEVLTFPELVVTDLEVGCGHCGATDQLAYGSYTSELNSVVPYDPATDPDDSRCVLLVNGDTDGGEGGYAPAVYCRGCRASSRIPDGLEVEWT